MRSRVLSFSVMAITGITLAPSRLTSSAGGSIQYPAHSTPLPVEKQVYNPAPAEQIFVRIFTSASLTSLITVVPAARSPNR